MTAAETGAARRWLAEALQVALALAGAWFLLALTDVALYERLSDGEPGAGSAALACVMTGPLSERVRGGKPDWGGDQQELRREVVPEASGTGELAAALARVKARVGPLTAGVRHGEAFYVAVDGIAELVGADLHQASSGAPAKLVCPAGIIEIVPFSRTAWRNFAPLDLAEAPRVIDERLYVPVEGLDALLPLSVKRDERARTWTLSCGEREVKVAAPEDLFEIEIDRSDRTLTVSFGGQRLVCWSCCVGAGNNSPIGHFHIQNKARWAPWRAYWGEYIPGGSRRNPLGARWLGTTARGYATGRAIGIHGTNQPSSIGRRISGGCIRLTNAHAIELYDTIPIGTRLTIRE